MTWHDKTATFNCFSWHKQLEKENVRIWGCLEGVINTVWWHMGLKFIQLFYDVTLRILISHFCSRKLFTTWRKESANIGGNFLQVCRERQVVCREWRGGCLMEGWGGMSGIQSSSGQWRKCFPVFFPSCSCEENSRTKFFRYKTRRMDMLAEVQGSGIYFYLKLQVQG